jgi:putative nucleotidyltransferase with HDIG domain
MDADEALLLGLVHDIGRQQTQRAAANRQSTCARLLNGGCPLAYVERLLFQCDHGDVGAEVLKAWDFPEHLTDAVRYHHRPEASDGVHAAVLYLIEFWTGGEEDLPSLTRLGSALARTGVSGETLMSIAPRRGSLYELLGAA